MIDIAFSTADLSEDKRVEVIGNAAMTRGQVSFMVEHDRVELGKANRYVHKILTRFPRLCEIAREIDAPVRNVITVHLMLRADG